MKKLFKLKNILVLIICFSLLCSCSLPGGDFSGKPDNSQTKNPAESGNPSGGNPGLSQNINIKSSLCNVENDRIELIFGFTAGSSLAGMEEKALSSVPKYEIETLSSPGRLKLRFYGIDFHEYVLENNIAKNAMICGSFSCYNAEKKIYDIYLQLLTDVDFKAKEDAGSLSIELSKKEASSPSLPSPDKYYVVADAFGEHSPKDFSGLSIALTPTLCCDYSTVVMISEGYESKAEAENSKVVIDYYLDELSFNKTAQVQKLSDFELPDANTEVFVPQKRSAGKLGNSDIISELDLENAIYLSAGSSGERLYIRTISPDTKLDTEKVTKDEIWVKKDGEAPAKLELGTDFYGISAAKYSYDGSYIAILDSSASSAIMYVYDVANHELLNLGEEGFGNLTAGFDWDTEKNTLYAMTGIKGSMQLIKYDFGQESGNISAIEEEPGYMTDIAYANGYIYFIERDESLLVRIPASGESGREILCCADNFSISPDGTMALILCSSEKEDKELFDVLLFNFETMEEIIILENTEPDKFGFMHSMNSNSFYIIKAADTEQDGLCELYMYSDSINYVLYKLVSSTLSFSPGGSTAYITIYSAGKNGITPDTYAFQISEQ